MLRLDAALHSVGMETLIVQQAAVHQQTFVAAVHGVSESPLQSNGGLRRAAALQDQSRRWQRDEDFRPFNARVVDGNLAAVFVDDAFADRHAEAGAGWFRREERLEDFLA